jgi:pyridoxine 4-dehydrogenase
MHRLDVTKLLADIEEEIHNHKRSPGHPRGYDNEERNCVAAKTLPGGTFTMAKDLAVTRMGYGAMQLAGPHVFGPPADRDAAVAVLRVAVELGITHIDTADFYGPHVTNQIIKEALYPYPDGVHIVTKVGAERDAEGNWPQARSPEQMRAQVHNNLRNLGLEVLDVVNLRVGEFSSPAPGSIAEPFSALAQMQHEGLIKHLGLSTVSAEQIAEAQSIAPVVCVQNFYNIAHRNDDHLVDTLAAQGIAYVPYFPLGGFSPLQSDTLQAAAARLHATPMAVALAWLLQRSPNILLIPGTSSVEHLRENVIGAGLTFPEDALAELNRIAARPPVPRKLWSGSRRLLRTSVGRGSPAVESVSCAYLGANRATSPRPHDRLKEADRLEDVAGAMVSDDGCTSDQTRSSSHGR